MTRKPDFILGIDPDTKNSALTLCDNQWSEPVVFDARLACATGRKAEHRLVEMGIRIQSSIIEMMLQVPKDCTVACVIESQAIRPTDPRPNDILNLAIVAGMAHSSCQSHAQAWGRQPPVLVLPQVWKGTIQKAKHQEWLRRVLAPSGLALLERRAGGTAKVGHLLDGYGLCRWLFEKTRTGVLLPF